MSEMEVKALSFSEKSSEQVAEYFDLTEDSVER